MAETVGEEVSNKQVILKDYVTGSPKESDLEIKTSNKILLKIPEGLSNAILLKKLYLSCDPYMRTLMTKYDRPNYVESFKPGSPISGYGVSKVLDSTDPNFKRGDLVWGFTSYEEYSLIPSPRSPHMLFKIEHTDVPLSYYAGILGRLLHTAVWIKCGVQGQGDI